MTRIDPMTPYITNCEKQKETATATATVTTASSASSSACSNSPAAQAAPATLTLGTGKARKVTRDPASKRRASPVSFASSVPSEGLKRRGKMMDISSTPSPPHHLVSSPQQTNISSNGLVALIDSFINSSSSSSNTNSNNNATNSSSHSVRREVPVDARPSSADERPTSNGEATLLGLPQEDDVREEVDIVVPETGTTYSDESPKSLKNSGSMSVTPTYASGGGEENESVNVSPSTTGSATYSAPVGNGSLSSGIHKNRNGIKTGKGATLKRVSFGSSKGSMVETLVYDHNEDEVLLHKRLLFSSCPASDGKRYLGLSNVTPPTGTSSSQSHHYHPHYPAHLPHHFHYPSHQWSVGPTGRHLGDRAESESTISGGVNERPSKFRVSLYDFEKPNLLTTTPDSPGETSAYFVGNNLSPPSTTTTVRSLAISTPTNNNSHSSTNLENTTPAHPTSLEMERKESTDSGIDNPFRPGGELSREAETIVNLIKEGKPITPTTPTKELTDTDGSPIITPNGNSHRDESIKEKTINAVNVSNNKSDKSPPGREMNGAPKSPTGIVEVQRTVISPPNDASQAEPVVLKKKTKCKCCVIQ